MMTKKRDIFIGDIHGCPNELHRLLAELNVTPEDRVISVGDLVDRGPGSVECWEFFRDRPNSVVLMGNHERKHVRGVLSYSQEIVRLQFGDRYPEFVAWASKLPYYLETPDVIVAHGGFEPGVALERQREDVLAATTSGTKYLERTLGGVDWPEKYDREKPIVFGHRVVGDNAQTWSRRAFAIDTGACHGGWLTALVVPGFKLHRVRAKSDYWRAEQKRWRLPVLRSKPWNTYKFSKLERELGDLRVRRAPAVQAFAAELDGWLRELDATAQLMVPKVHAHLKELSRIHEAKALRKAIATQSHPALLFAAQTGSLGANSIKQIATTPARLIEAAQAYGVRCPSASPSAAESMDGGPQ